MVTRSAAKKTAEEEEREAKEKEEKERKPSQEVDIAMKEEITSSHKE